MHLRVRDSLQRRTVCNDEEGCLSQQFWCERAVATIWWDLELVYQSLRKSCNKFQREFRWIKVFNERAAVEITNEVGQPPFQVRRTNEESVSLTWLNANICNSLALYTFIAISTDRCKPANVEVFVSSLVKLLPRVCGWGRSDPCWQH